MMELDGFYEMSAELKAIALVSSFAACLVVHSLVTTLYSVYFGPLAKFPGPIAWAFSPVPRIRALALGEERRLVTQLHDRYGEIVRIGPNELSFASGSGTWKGIYGSKEHGQQRTQKDGQFYSLTPPGKSSITVANDADHGRQRRLLSHAFSDRSLKEWEPLIKSYANLMKEKLAEHANSTEPVDLLKVFNCTTFDIMGELAFSENLGMLNEGEYSPWVAAIFQNIRTGALIRASRMLSSVLGHIVAFVVKKAQGARSGQREHARRSTDRVSKRLEQTPEHNDIWSIILKRQDQGEGLTSEEQRANASFLMIAGSETTATALSGTTYFLVKNPNAMRALTNEIRGTFVDFDNVKLDNISQLRYLNATLQEGLRMYPPVPTSLARRTPPEGLSIDGHWIPGNTTVGGAQFATYRMSQHFKHPYKFAPERWLGDPEFKDDHLDAVEPFLVGPRNCLGKNLAWYELRLLLVIVFLNFDLQLCEQSNHWDDQRTYILWEKKPLLCTVTPAATEH